MSRSRRSRGPVDRAPARTRAGRAVLVVGLAVLALVLLLLSSRDSRRARPSHAEGTAGDDETSSTGSRKTSAGAASTETVTAASAARQAPGMRGAVPRLRDMPAYEYPSWSQPLTEGTDPSKTTPDDVPLDSKTGVHVILGPRRFVVHPPDPIVIDLRVVNNLGASMPIRDGVVRFRPDQTTATTGPSFDTPLVDDGSGADLVRLDNGYTATFAPTADQQAALFKGGEHVLVEVAFDAPNRLGPRLYPLVVMYSPEPHATLNGNYTDTATGGDLLINAGVTASQPGTYRMIGSLYSGDGARAISYATAAATLPAGDGVIPLRIFGKVLHDSGIDGPYELRFAMLFEVVKEGEEIPGDTVDPAYTTSAYRFDTFSGAAYQAPASNEPVVDMNSPSQQGKPPPLFSDDERRPSTPLGPPVVGKPGPH
jgi:hypothetical protein